jgi:hypothetical protein
VLRVSKAVSRSDETEASNLCSYCCRESYLSFHWSTWIGKTKVSQTRTERQLNSYLGRDCPWLSSTVRVFGLLAARSGIILLNFGLFLLIERHFCHLLIWHINRGAILTLNLCGLARFIQIGSLRAGFLCGSGYLHFKHLEQIRLALVSTLSHLGTLLRLLRRGCGSLVGVCLLLITFFGHDCILANHSSFLAKTTRFLAGPSLGLRRGALPFDSGILLGRSFFSAWLGVFCAGCLRLGSL